MGTLGQKHLDRGKLMRDSEILEYIFTKYKDKERDLNEQYRYTPPYPTLSLDEFIPPQLSELLYEESKTIPKDYWTAFTRADSYMEECKDLTEAPVARQLVSAFHSREFLTWLSQVCDVKHLLPDPYLVGAGYMKSFRGDSLKIHSDFNWNEECQTHRALSLILYFTPDWKPEWHGDLQFWDFEKKRKVVSYPPKMGNMVLWKYHKRGFHGHPNPIDCPEDKFRVGFRFFYYISDSKHDWRDPPHKSLYWYDKDKNQPYHIDTEYGHKQLKDD
tara:strand:+ start:17 stop:835 length:819 start_codon:yes stop_codon:yes gene_type:complete